MNRFSLLSLLSIFGVAMVVACNAEVVPLGGESPITSTDGGAPGVDGAAPRADDASVDAGLPEADGGPAREDDASVDGGPALDGSWLMTCGSTACDPLSTWCKTFVSGTVQADGGPGVSTSCQPLPTSPPCSNSPSCAACGFSACTGIASGCECTDTNGELRVTYYGI